MRTIIALAVMALWHTTASELLSVSVYWTITIVLGLVLGYIVFKDIESIMI